MDGLVYDKFCSGLDVKHAHPEPQESNLADDRQFIKNTIIFLSRRKKSHRKVAFQHSKTILDVQANIGFTRKFEERSSATIFDAVNEITMIETE